MAATRITPGASTPQGVLVGASVATDVTNGNVIANTESLHLACDNSAGIEPVTFTFTTVATLGGYAVEDLVVTVAIGEHMRFGHFPQRVFSSDLYFTTSVAANVTSHA